MKINSTENTLPLISIIIPVFNASAYLNRCLQSVIRQSYHELEIVVVDDGSTDGSDCICDYFAAVDNRVKVFHISNGGVSNARNFALERVTGDFVSFVDSDDYISLNLIKVLYNILIETNASISTCHSVDFTGECCDYFEESIRSTTIINPCDYNYCEKYAHTIVWGALFEKNTIQGLRFSTDLKVGEDTLFFAQAVLNANLIVDVDASLYYYNVRSDSLCHIPYNDDCFTEVIARDRIINLFFSNSKKSLLSCYGSRSLVALKGLKRNYLDHGWHNSLNVLLIKYIRKEIMKTMKSPISWQSKRTLVAACIAPRLFLIIFARTKGTIL